MKQNQKTRWRSEITTLLNCPSDTASPCVFFCLRPGWTANVSDKYFQYLSIRYYAQVLVIIFQGNKAP